MDKPVADIKDRIAEALRARNMKPIELSEKTKIPKAAISHYMTGYNKPKQDRLYLISKALNVSPTWLLGYNVPMEEKTREQAIHEGGILIDVAIDQDVMEIVKQLLELPPEKLQAVKNMISVLRS